MSRWLLRAPESLNSYWQWCLTGQQQDVATGTLANFTQQRAASGISLVWLLLPASQVLTVAANVPLRQQRQMQSAYPFLLEESLAGDIEQCHVVAGRRIDDQRLQLASVERATLAAALSMLKEHGIEPAVVSAESLLLPNAELGATIFLDGENSLLATAEGQALLFDQADATAVATLFVPRRGDRINIHLGLKGDLIAARALESEWLAAGSDDVAVSIDETPHAALAFLAASQITPVNFRQGEFALNGSGGFSPGFNWHPLAWLAAAWIMLALAYQIAVGYSYTKATNQVRAQQVEFYKRIFPKAQNVSYPRAQMEGKLRAGAGGASFTEILAKTADTLMALSGKDSGRYRPQNLSWDTSQGELHVDVLARGLDDIEPLRAALQKTGLAVEIGAGVSQPGGYKARLNIGMASAVTGGVR